jgi:hypothetical protein
VRKSGERHFRAKVPDAIVREMRGKYLEWKAMGLQKGYRVLGRIYGVNRWTVRDIVTYRTRIDA